jgi:hypothetical protein
MDNKFFQFVETYKDDIKAFFEAVFAAIKALMDKFGAGAETTDPEV